MPKEIKDLKEFMTNLVKENQNSEVKEGANKP